MAVDWNDPEFMRSPEARKLRADLHTVVIGDARARSEDLKAAEAAMIVAMRDRVPPGMHPPAAPDPSAPAEDTVNDIVMDEQNEPDEK